MNHLNVNTTLDDNLTSTESSIDLEIKCNLLKNLTESQSKKGIFCDVYFDSLVCWPRTAALKTAIMPCFSSLNGYPYDSSKNATKLCLANGTWLPANYGNCKSLNDVTDEENLVKIYLSNIKETSKIFLFGYGISLIVLIIALFIFLYFKELKCMRNRIHTNLIIAYILLHILWIITFENFFIEHQFHCILFLFLNYFLTTTYFWMFVEGLYLYLLVMQTFSVDKLPLYFYNFIGWGVPSILFIIWTPLKHIYGVSKNNMVKCKLIDSDDLDYIYIVPILIVLLLNIFFMFVIIYVLITKLRVSNSAESQQYRKATKAMLVLIPLLGAFWLFLIVPPQEETGKIIFLNIRAALLSTQGLFVAILYCFLNGEVKSCIKNHLERWKELKKFNSRPNVNKGSASSGSTLLPPINENDTLDSNDIRIKIPLLRGQQLQDFNNPFYNSSPNNDHLKSIFKQTHNSDDLKHNFACFNPE